MVSAYIATERLPRASAGRYRTRSLNQISCQPLLLRTGRRHLTHESRHLIGKLMPSFGDQNISHRQPAPNHARPRSPLPRTSLDVAKDLHALVTRADLKPPFVIAGQSFGGMNARMYAHLYPEELAGLVLIDSSHPDMYPEVAKAVPARAPGDPDYDLVNGWREGPDLSKSREWVDLKANADLVRATGGIGDKPLTVLTQSPQWNDPYAPDDIEPIIDEVVQRLQTRLATLSTNRKFIVAAKAGHNIQAEEPQLVIDAILGVVAQVRTSEH